MGKLKVIIDGVTVNGQSEMTILKAAATAGNRDPHPVSPGGDLAVRQLQNMCGGGGRKQAAGWILPYPHTGRDGDPHPIAESLEGEAGDR